MGVVRLPDLVGPVGAASKDKFMPVPIGCRALESQGHQGRVQCLDDPADNRVARRQRASSARFGRGESVQRRHARAGLRQCKSLDKPNHSWVYAPRAGIGARSQVESTRTTRPVEPKPTLKSTGADPGFTGKGGKGNLVLDVKPKDSPALIAGQEHLHLDALARGEGLLVAVKSRTAPAHETGRVLRGASLRPGILRNR